jgi:hypothetical protein
MLSLIWAENGAKPEISLQKMQSGDEISFLERKLGQKINDDTSLL